MLKLPRTYWNSLKKEEQETIFNFLTQGKVNQSNVIKTAALIKPYWLPCLYCSGIFDNIGSEATRVPEIGTKTRLFDNTNLDPTKMKLTCDDDNMLNGTLFFVEGDVSMRWKGYASRLCDGALHLAQVVPDATINGRVGDQHFFFGGATLSGGKWPGFLVICS